MNNDEDYSVLLPDERLTDTVCFQSVQDICDGFINYRYKLREMENYEIA